MITEEQKWPALTLAQAFGHAWASCPREIIHSGDEELIGENSRNRGEWGSAVLAPQIDPAGSIVHATGTGRLRWSISPAGDTVVEVWRTTAELPICCLKARVSREFEASVEVLGAYGTRHIGALATVLQPLIQHSDRVLYLLGPLWAGAEAE